ncbi:purine and uridine phosphorylase [Trichoderma velutinum]
MSNPDDYTVGWVCAIKEETTAAEAFLDEVHEEPEAIATEDINSYTQGKIGQHNVVIAVLPAGEYGIASAAIVVANMQRSYRKLRFILIVGIGGGAPSPSHDIRLGDILARERQPLKMLRHEYEKDISKILEKNPRLRKKYGRPNQLSDKLYRSDIIHPINNNASCEKICGNGEKDLVFRPERTEHEANPAVHYGPIASANTLMKDSTIRDKMAAEKGILCFEMEAAGIMNQFPALLVIRGICDYSDSHKNKVWQGYAAMTAAAYAKDLLSQITI